jgi:hypothetical protein
MCSKPRSRAEDERNQRAHALANVTGLTQSLRRPTIPPWTAAVSRAGYAHCDDCGARIRIMAKASRMIAVSAPVRSKPALF